tara:strand:+ start:2626 stop:3477 length:852 start_codon:yes stop_codon:yes gene_type:complete
MSKYERSKNAYERSEYATPIEDLRSEEENISIGRQRISRAERSNLRYIRNAERQALAFSNSAETNRKIKEAADKARNEIINRSNEERGKLVAGVLYDSMQYDPPTNNRQGVDSISTSSESASTDSISGDAAPGNSTGSAQDGLANVNIVTFDPIDDSGEFVPITESEPIRTIDWYRYDRAPESEDPSVEGDLFFGNAVNPNTRGGIKDFRIEYSGGLVFQTTQSGGGFNIQDGDGNAKIRLFLGDLPATGVTTEEPAKFREIKVCLNGVPATMSVLGTNPVAS